MKHLYYFKNLFSLIVFLFLSTVVFSQADRIRVFTDCNCDRNYIRQELSSIDHVRDQALADVQLFINNITNGSGGQTYQLNFRGNHKFANIKKEIEYQTSPTMTRDEIRKGLVQKILLGLLPFLMESDMADQILISLPKQSKFAKQAITEEDPWNNWIFEVYGRGSFNKESSRRRFNIEMGFEMDRVTEEWRIRGDVEFNISENRFESDEENFLSTRQHHYLSGSIVKSLGNHWSAGVFSGINHSTYRNINWSTHFQPAIEYNLFPYNEVLKREIVVAYKIGAIYNNYIEETLYGKQEELLYSHSVSAQMRFRQPWGDVSASLTGSSYLHDLTKNSLRFNGYAAIRVFKGLAIRPSANLELIRNQLNLPIGSASLEDILLRQRQIATDFELSFSIGLSYTFGSAFNNIVNTRL